MLIKRTIIQIGIFIALVGMLEGAARLAEKVSPRSEIDLQLYMEPYLMFVTGGPTRGSVWEDVVAKRRIPSSVALNNFGYIEDFDFKRIPDDSYIRQHGKKPGERLIIITGGSVVHGVGATKNENTIAGRMMYHLNKGSNGVRYRVINMGMGGWIAYQQFIGLSLFGLPLEPDWIVVMDGYNDAVVPCLHGSGAGNPMGWPTMLYLTYGGTGQLGVTGLLSVLARHSAMVRWISGLQADKGAKDRRRLVFDDSDPDSRKRFQIKMAGVTMEDELRQVDFYLQAQRNLLMLFRRSNIMFSTQPLLSDNNITPLYRSVFASDGMEYAALNPALDAFASQTKNHSCEKFADLNPSGAVGYFMGKSAVRLAGLAASEQEADRSRHIIYQNAEGALPYDHKQREQLFIDNAHMSDPGQDRVGRFFAENILAAERGEKFTWSTWSPEPDAQTPKGTGISIISATYGPNCKALSGNATGRLRNVCNGRFDCQYRVDVAILGDPAPGCGKAFSVEYECLPDRAKRNQTLPGEAGFGSLLTLDCPRPN